MMKFWITFCFANDNEILEKHFVISHTCNKRMTPDCDMSRYHSINKVAYLTNYLVLIRYHDNSINKVHYMITQLLGLHNPGLHYYITAKFQQRDMGRLLVGELETVQPPLEGITERFRLLYDLIFARESSKQLEC